jgi:hypothetical protein
MHFRHGKAQHMGTYQEEIPIMLSFLFSIFIFFPFYKASKAGTQSFSPALSKEVRQLILLLNIILRHN